MADPTATLNKLLGKQAKVIDKAKEEAARLAQEQAAASTGEKAQPTPPGSQPPNVPA